MQITLNVESGTRYHNLMAMEIERKFLLINDSWRMQVDRRQSIVQGYLNNCGGSSIRIRLAGDSAFINIKSMTLGVSRSEYDYPIPVADARAMLNELCLQPLISKTRFYLRHGGHTWEIDEFSGENSGLIIAELELEHEAEEFEKPGWLGAEVSHDPRYYNVSLVETPYSQWK